MKTLFKTMIVFATITLFTPDSVFAGNAAAETSAVVPSELGSAQVKQSGVVLPSREKRLADLYLKMGSLRSRFGETSSVLVIPSAEITTEEIATITEDMNIMSRILEKNLEKAHINVGGMFISSSSDPFHIAFSRGRQSTQGMYLQGYGALFLMKVDFPLSPGPKVEEETEQTQKVEDTDEVWEQMREEMFEPEKTRKDKDDRPKIEYDSQKVESLKTHLVQSLKHATNLRNLTADESVILTVTGSGISSGYKSVSRIPGRNEVVVVDRSNRAQIIGTDLVGDIGLSLPTVLVIRAKKSDIDRFAKGDLDFDQFQQNTQILTSAYMADQGGLGSPMTGYYNYGISQK